MLDQALSLTDTANRAQSSQQDRHVAGLKDVVSIGAGQKAESLAGRGDVATTSLRKSVNDAQISFQNRQATANRNARMGLSTSSNANDNSQGLRAAIMED